MLSSVNNETILQYCKLQVSALLLENTAFVLFACKNLSLIAVIMSSAKSRQNKIIIKYFESTNVVKSIQLTFIRLSLNKYKDVDPNSQVIVPSGP